MAARHTTVTRTIQATPQTVWDLLTDLDSYADWNPTIISIQGDVTVGGMVKLVSTVDPKRTFKVSVTELTPPRRMLWADGMPLGLFRGVRTYDLAPADGGTVFTMTEDYTGPLAGLVTKAIPDMSESCTQIADGLKVAAEARD